MSIQVEHRTVDVSHYEMGMGLLTFTRGDRMVDARPIWLVLVYRPSGEIKLRQWTEERVVMDDDVDRMRVETPWGCWETYMYLRAGDTLNLIPGGPSSLWVCE